MRVRWLGRVHYRDAHALQRGLFEHGADVSGDRDWLLLLEHPHVYTLGVRADLSHVLVPPASVGADLVRSDRGGDVTYHGPGQLVGYPIMSVEMGPNAIPCYVHRVEQLVIDALTELGLPNSGRLGGYPGVWVDPDGPNPRKICAIGVRVSRGRTMHGFALNVDPDMSYFGHIVPCGIADKPVTSLAAEGVKVPMRRVVDILASLGDGFRPSGTPERQGERQDVAWQPRIPIAGQVLRVDERKPEWLRAKAHMGADYLALKKTMRDLDLVTVCEEAGCPNIFECWADGTATFMINGERCTRACGFCLVDTDKPLPLDAEEPERVGEAVERMRLQHAVITAVARDDLPDHGAGAFAETIRAIRRRRPGCAVEVLIPDCKGDADALQTIFDARPDVLNHNLETVARLQRAVRPSAGYARSLAVLARAKAAGLVTKSGIILGMGETDDEVLGALADLRGVGVDIVTLGQYLRPSAAHLPVARWVRPEQFTELKVAGEALGIGHVEASPFTRSSYHARQAAEGALAWAEPTTSSTTA